MIPKKAMPCEASFTAFSANTMNIQVFLTNIFCIFQCPAFILTNVSWMLNLQSVRARWFQTMEFETAQTDDEFQSNFFAALSFVVA